jgi:hypothetical protein
MLYDRKIIAADIQQFLPLRCGVATSFITHTTAAFENIASAENPSAYSVIATLQFSIRIQKLFVVPSLGKTIYTGVMRQSD